MLTDMPEIAASCGHAQKTCAAGPSAVVAANTCDLKSPLRAALLRISSGLRVVKSALRDAMSTPSLSAWPIDMACVGPWAEIVVNLNSDRTRMCLQGVASRIEKGQGYTGVQAQAGRITLLEAIGEEVALGRGGAGGGGAPGPGGD